MCGEGGKWGETEKEKERDREIEEAGGGRDQSLLSLERSMSWIMGCFQLIIKALLLLTFSCLPSCAEF